MPSEETHTSSVSFTLLDQGRAVNAAAEIEGETVRLAPDVLRGALGWECKPEGFCKGGVCIPFPAESPLRAEAAIDLRAFAALIGRPMAIDAAERTAFLGTSARQRGQALASLQAPDFTLPDLEGKLHSLSEQRGKKVLLIAYASW